MFVVYIDDPPTTVQSETQIVMHTDDTNALISGRDISDSVMTTRRIQKDILIWLERNHLTLNAEKTGAVNFRTSHSIRAYHNVLNLSGNRVLFDDVSRGGG